MEDFLFQCGEQESKGKEDDSKLRCVMTGRVYKLRPLNCLLLFPLAC